MRKYARFTRFHVTISVQKRYFFSKRLFRRVERRRVEEVSESEQRSMRRR